MQNSAASKKPIIVIAISLIVIAAVGLTALSNQPGDQVNDPVANQQSADPTTSDQGAPAPSNRKVIKYTGEGFEPRDITVKRGTIVNVRNESQGDMQFSSDDHPAHQGNTEMNMGILKPGESMSYTANKVGTWGYHDNNDESKTGTVTVEE